MPDIYAVGDCASFGRYKNRPHWAFAQESGKIAAGHILKKEEKNLKIDESFVWSAIGKMHIRAVGKCLRDTDVVKSQFFEKELSRVCLYLDENDFILGACSINADPICAKIANLLQNGQVIYYVKNVM